ncbi:ATP-binding protein [Octadecabacter sp. CECT 8868]|uniref:sensor histidine kinase n=1 Tax=Octadecabacter algicola TaxID=2909342 RepID=UPI001F2683BE|nr:ATP-binding protein [Octadecabacter algicola]MCF2905623.1 ATP-binding protein [Octadecabacter algicola]
MYAIRALVPALVLGLAAGIYGASFSYFKAQEIEKAAARLTLYRSTLESELRHFSHLPFLLSLDPFVIRGISDAQIDGLDYRLARYSQSAGLDAVFLMDAEGLTIAASNARSDSSFKGQNYAYRPYFQDAQQGQLGEFYGIGATTGIPGYFYAMVVRSAEAGQSGVIAIKIDLSRLQDDWLASGERIILANADGVVLLASDPAWRYKTLGELSDDQRERILASRQFGTESLEPLDWSPDEPSRTATLGGENLNYLSTTDLPNSWSLHFFTPHDQATTRAWLVTGLFLAFVLFGFTALQFARFRRVRTALDVSEQEEAQLRLANERLAVEIDERRAAQRTLQKTQAELERAGRLAALGQLASSVTHELGQPIAAMRNQLAAAEMTEGATSLNTKMQGLAARMENITRQLKFFSRKGRDSFETFDLRDTVHNALTLLEPSILARKAEVIFDDVAQGEMTLHANKLRIEQVITNIVRNALDAVEGQDVRRVLITLGHTSNRIWFEVADTGHGLQGQTLEDLREPFATTRESGEGMGLGLTISAGIVTDHNGTISAKDGPEGGTIFRIELPRNQEDSS